MLAVQTIDRVEFTYVIYCLVIWKVPFSCENLNNLFVICLNNRLYAVEQNSKYTKNIPFTLRRIT